MEDIFFYDGGNKENLARLSSSRSKKLSLLYMQTLRSKPSQEHPV